MKEIQIGDKIRIKSSRHPLYWYNNKIGEVFEVKRYAGYDNKWIPSKVVVQREGCSGQSLIDIQDVELYEKGEKQMEAENASNWRNDVMEIYAAPRMVIEYFEYHVPTKLIWKRSEKSEAEIRLEAMEKQMQELQENMDKLQQEIKNEQS